VLFFLARQRDDLGELARAVSDPASKSYGRHLPVATIARAYGGSPEAIARVTTFLAARGIASEVDVTGTFVAALLDPAQVTALFGADPHPFQPVPPELTGAATGIVGAFRSKAASARFLPARPRAGHVVRENEIWPDWAMGSGTPAPCPALDPDRCSNAFPNPGPPAAFRSFTPDQLRTAYGIAPTGLTGRGRSAVVVEFGQRVHASDVEAYADGLGLPRVPLEQVIVDDRGTAIPVGAEATLDVETIAGLAPGLARLTLLTTTVETNAEFFTYWPLIFSRALDAATTGGRLTDVISVSWGVGCERELPSDVLIDATEVLFQTAAAAGVTISAAAGDQGSTSCTTRHPPYEKRHVALAYPGSSPWVTSVGGTSLVLAADDSILDVRVWNDWPLQLEQPLPQVGCSTPPCRPAPVWAGAGGRSVVFERPPWQVGDGVETEAGRQAPDVAFLADIYPGTLLHLDGSWKGAGNGTSQAAPIFASLVLLLNEAAASAGRARVGFAPPLLYHLARSAPEAFVDVVQGDNVIGDNERRFDADCCFAGAGYDRTTGWGSLLLDRALAALERPRRLIAIEPRTRLPVRTRR